MSARFKTWVYEDDTLVTNHVRVMKVPIAYVVYIFSWLIKESKLIKMHGKRNFKTQGPSWWEQQVANCTYTSVNTHFCACAIIAFLAAIFFQSVDCIIYRYFVRRYNFEKSINPDLRFI